MSYKKLQFMPAVFNGLASAPFLIDCCGGEIETHGKKIMQACNIANEAILTAMRQSADAGYMSAADAVFKRYREKVGKKI